MTPRIFADLAPPPPPPPAHSAALASPPGAHPPATAAAAASTPTVHPSAAPLATATPVATPTATATTSAAPATGVDDRSATFQAVDAGTETHSGSTLMVEAYAVLWVILMGWIVLLWRKQSGLHARLDDLEQAIDRAGDKADSAAARSGNGDDGENARARA